MRRGRPPVLGRAMTESERNSRYRARKAGKPLPIDRDCLHKLIDQQFQFLAYHADREGAERTKHWLDHVRRVLHISLDGEPVNQKTLRSARADASASPPDSPSDTSGVVTDTP